MFQTWFNNPPVDAVIEVAEDHLTAITGALKKGGLTVYSCVSEQLPVDLINPSINEKNFRDRNTVSQIFEKVCKGLPLKPRRVGLVVPDGIAKVSLLRFEQVPRSHSDLEKLIRWQMKRVVPFSIEEARITYTPGRNIGINGQEFLVVAAKHEIVDQYESLCAAIGAHAGLVDLATLSLLNFYLIPGQQTSGDWILVNTQAGSMSIAVVRDDKVIFYRNNVDNEVVTTTNLVHQTVMYYQDHLSGQGFCKGFIRGTSKLAHSIQGSLKALTGCPVELIEPGSVSPVLSIASTSKVNMHSIVISAGLLAQHSYSEQPN
jgi:Tfp pilus assembly PilM family ATPase